MRSDSGKLGWSGHLNMKTPALSLLTEIGDDRGNLEILTEFLTGNYQFRPNAESFG